MRAAAEVIGKKGGLDRENPGAFEKLSDAEKEKISKLGNLLMWIEFKIDSSPPDQKSAERIATMKKLANSLERGQVPDDKFLQEILKSTNADIAPHWRRLELLCHRLEALAHKQLRGKRFSEPENGFLKSYGIELAGIMLYGGNSYLTPRDDAPRIADVFSNPELGKYLEVGIARPRGLYVLYPVKGGEILCRGAILPFYEFTYSKRLTDAEWKTLQDSKDRPALPNWIEPLVGSSAALPHKD